MKAAIVARGVPATPLSPFAPGLVVIVRTDGISGLYGRTIGAEGGIVGGGMPMPRRCRGCRQGKDYSDAQSCWFHGEFPSFGWGCSTLNLYHRL